MSSRTGSRLSSPVAATLQAILFVVVFAASGALAGVVWERLWDAPDGIVFEGQWYFEPGGPDYAFSGTGWYVVVAVVAGALTTLVLGWLLPRHELLSLAAIAVGSMVAGRVMFGVGHALGPQDPQALAAGKDDFSTLPTDLVVVGAGDQPQLFGFDSSAFVAFPVGALAAAVFVFLVMTGRRSRHASVDEIRGIQGPRSG